MAKKFSPMRFPDQQLNRMQDLLSAEFKEQEASVKEVRDAVQTFIDELQRTVEALEEA